MALERRIIFLSTEQIARLLTLARGRKLAELVREAVDEYLDRRESKSP
jgi:hypothetical protein